MKHRGRIEKKQEEIQEKNKGDEESKIKERGHFHRPFRRLFSRSLFHI